MQCKVQGYTRIVFLYLLRHRFNIANATRCRYRYTYTIHIQYIHRIHETGFRRESFFECDNLSYAAEKIFNRSASSTAHAREYVMLIYLTNATAIA